MNLTNEEKKNYIDAISDIIFKKPFHTLLWKQTNTILCNIIVRNRTNEIEDDESEQLLNYTKEQRILSEQPKPHYNWMD